jgi:hypothetical protein
MKAFYLRNGEEVELEPGHRVDPGDNREMVDIQMRLEEKERSFEVGKRITFTSAEFSEIAFACYFLGQQLSSRLPKPILAEAAG